jgi:hypothetical protein
MVPPRTRTKAITEDSLAGMEPPCGLVRKVGYEMCSRHRGDDPVLATGEETYAGHFEVADHRETAAVRPLASRFFLLQ